MKPRGSRCLTEFSAGFLQEVPVQQRFKLPDEDLDPKYKNFMDKAWNDSEPEPKKTRTKCHGQFGGSPSACWFCWQVFSISKMEKRMCFFSRKTSAMDDGLNFNTLINDD